MERTSRAPVAPRNNVARIHAAMAGSVVEAEAHGAGRRAYLSGLWLATMGVLLDAGSPDDIALLLADRAASIRGQGRNADAPPVVLDGEALLARTREATVVARVVLDRLRPVAEDDEAGDSFPEDLLDVVLTLLQPKWGPSHLRRALVQQVASLEAGSTVAILPAEPSVPDQPTPPRPTPVQPGAARLPVQEGGTQAPSPGRAPRDADVHVDSEGLATGRGAYAVALNLSTGDRRETREISGTALDRTGRDAAIRGLVEALAAVTPAIPGDRIRISTPVEAVFRAACPDGNGVRLFHEAVLWSEFDKLSAGLTIEWCLRRSGTGTDLAQRCDRMLRARSVEAEREAVTAA